MPELSIIVPVYNVEAFLAECLDSILKQSFSNLELILIDDGSPDGSGQICDVYAAKDTRVTVIHQSNKGVSAARNAGLQIASGRYIGFVDPDDYISQDMYQKLIAKAGQEEADMAICGFSYCSEDGKELRKEPVPEGVYSREELLSSIYGMPNPFHGSMCNKVFSGEILRGLCFDESVAIGEDWLLLYECYLKTERAAAISGCCYTVRVRNNSATRKYKASVYENKLKTYLKLYEYSRRQSRQIQKKAATKILDACLMNKLAIQQQDYQAKSIAFVNKKIREISVEAFFHGNLSFKQAVSHYLLGMKK